MEIYCINSHRDYYKMKILNNLGRLQRREHLDQVSAKYHLVDGDGVALPAPDAVTDRPPLRKFPKVVLGKVGMSLYWLHLGIIPTLFVHGLDGSQFPFMLSDFVEGKVVARDLGSDDFKLPMINDIFTYGDRNDNNTQNDDEEDSESSTKVHELYDDTNNLRTPPVSTDLVTVSNDDGDDESGEGPLVRRKRGRDSAASTAITIVLAGGEGSSGRVLKRFHSLDHGAFHDFANSFSVGHPSSYMTQLNMNNPPHDAVFLMLDHCLSP
ncbi:unnamed protein product [Lactuca saligna]|uniref:Uncharacterized protein n=1 Tax=Lactuca saligna TaxID=75948 RepID=A0AA35ZFS1_LACSI|nr:unnamed protein product [Lactuca saligna]